MSAGGNSGGGAPSSGGTKADARRENRRNEKTIDRGGEGETQAKSYVQPKVESQMNAVKPDLVPAGPTEVEMTEDERSLKTKKKGRKSTILTSATGLEEEAQLSRKTLLG